MAALTSWLAAVSSSSKADTLSSDTRSLSLTWRDKKKKKKKKWTCRHLLWWTTFLTGCCLNSNLGKQRLTWQRYSWRRLSLPPSAFQQNTLLWLQSRQWDFKVPVSERIFQDSIYCDCTPSLTVGFAMEPRLKVSQDPRWDCCQDNFYYLECHAIEQFFLKIINDAF